MAEELRNLIEKEPKPVKKISLSAILSFVMGICAYLLVFFHSLLDLKFLLAVIIAQILALIAVISGHKAKRQIRKGDGYTSGKKLANIGLILGYLFIGILILILVLTILGVGGLIAVINGLIGG